VFIIWVIQRRDNLKENSWNASVCGSNVYGKEEAIAALTSKTKNYIKECFCYQRFQEIGFGILDIPFGLKKN